jgi:hypothetical protein
MKPVVDGLEQELAGRLRVIRLNVQDPVGKALAGELGFRMTPTFVFFDAQGLEAWREIGRLDAARVRKETP